MFYTFYRGKNIVSGEHGILLAFIMHTTALFKILVAEKQCAVGAVPDGQTSVPAHLTLGGKILRKNLLETEYVRYVFRFFLYTCHHMKNVPRLDWNPASI